jgi:hypothetical protein
MTADAALLARKARARLERERELADLDRLMRQPGSLAEAPEPVPLHRAGRTTKNFSTESTKNFSTAERTAQ